MSSGKSNNNHNNGHHTTNSHNEDSIADSESMRSKQGLWGAFAGLIVAVLIAFPLSAAWAFATHPTSQKLFGGRLEETSQFGYSLFWWLMVLLIASLPFLVGFGIAKLSSKGLAIAGAIIAVFIILILVLGQLFVF
ncbi:hypothetical protein EV379_0756 [Microterricola gilva]|uniref:Uncharacterized protein n=1 Tax=Microterricola gilva TaxID=393267 RepID=A0A4Q8AKA1_9MICO|nr:hypothetical protein [Microterricola gilva]RZU64461.1 hypothetical protein EV379_0756 [Microterricola gilva]